MASAQHDEQLRLTALSAAAHGPETVPVVLVAAW
jgi:hypothetical protein